MRRANLETTGRIRAANSRIDATKRVWPRCTDQPTANRSSAPFRGIDVAFQVAKVSRHRAVAHFRAARLRPGSRWPCEDNKKSPAEAGLFPDADWIPACAGMTGLKIGRASC